MSCENFGDLSDQCRDVNLNRNKTQIHPVRCRNRPRGDPVDTSPGGLSNFTTSQLQFEAAIEVSIYSTQHKSNYQGCAGKCRAMPCRGWLNKYCQNTCPMAKQRAGPSK